MTEDMMLVEEFCNNLGERTAGPEAGADLPEKLAREIGRFFGVRPHEVGLFTLNGESKALVFRWPRTLSERGNIPLTASHSAVARTVNEGKPILDNAFASTRHLYIVEHLLAEREERVPVQKMMSAPLCSAEGIRGVIQVSRKGESREHAGPDFTPADLAALEKIAAVVGSLPL